MVQTGFGGRIPGRAAIVRRILARRILPAWLLIIVAYAAWPYVALFQLDQAIRHGDAAALERLVDWDSVREGLKEDVCDDVTDMPQAEAQAVKSGEALAPFGFSFVRGIAGNMIDENITAGALVAAARQAGMAQLRAAAPPGPAGDTPRVVWAFFDGPASFAVILRPADPRLGPVRAELELHAGHWQVVRAWLPRELLLKANTRI